MTVRVTFIFSQTTASTTGTVQQTGRAGGWTESFISGAASVTDPGLQNLVGKFLAARIPLLANQARCIAARFHDINSNATRSYPVAYGWFGSGGDCTLPQVSVLLRLFAQNSLNNRAYEMRGIPSSWLLTGELRPGNPPAAALGNLMSLIMSNFGMLGVDKTQKHYKVNRITGGGIVTLDEPQTTLVTPGYVYFYRTTFDGSCCGSVGKFYATAAGAQSITLSGWDPTKTASGGTVGNWAKPTYQPFDQSTTPSGAPNGWELQRSVIRKVGRPFDQFTGRRSPKCCNC